MPVIKTTKTVKSYKKKGRYYGRSKLGRTKRYKNYKKSDFNYGKINTIGLPHNLWTYVRMSSVPRTFNLPVAVPTPPFQTASKNGYVFGYNLLTPWNMDLINAIPYQDVNYFGLVQTPSTEQTFPPAANLLTWARQVWWANFYTKMRISHVWMTTQITLADKAPTGFAAPNDASNNSPLLVTYVEGKYVPGIMTPQLLNDLNSDDLQATKGAKSWLISPDNKRLIIRRKISIKKFLGCTNLNDVRDSECAINPTMSAADLTARLVRNPDQRNAVFGYLRVRRPVAKEGEVNIPMRYSIQTSMVAKVQFFQQRLTNINTQTGTLTGVDDPDTGSSSV